MTNTSNKEPLFTADNKLLSELISKVAFRKIEALADLYKLIKPAVYGYALSFLKSQSDAKIVLHSTFLSIWVSAYMFTGQGKALPWIMMIAKNHCFKIMRNRKWYSNLYSSEDAAAKTNQFVLSAEETAALDTFLSALEDEEREIIALNTIIGLSTVEIADFLNQPLLKVILLKNKAFNKLKKAAKENETLAPSANSVFLKECIKASVSKTTCENWNNIAFDIANGRGEVVGMSDQKPKNRFAGIIKTLIALAVVLSIVLFAFLNRNRADFKAVSTIYFEAGAEFELSLNTYNVVLEATANNSEGKKVLKELSLEEAKLETAINSILKSLIKNNCLTENSNVLLIKAENDSVGRASKLQSVIALHTKDALEDQDLITNVVILRNYATDNLEEITAKATEFNITEQRVDLINFIITSGSQKSFEELSKLSIKELTTLLKGVKDFEKLKYENDPDGKVVYVSNDPKEIPKKEVSLDYIIEPGEALNKAIEHAQVERSQVYEAKSQFNSSSTKNYHYDVSFAIENTTYIYKIDAITGDVIKSETKPRI